MDMDPEARSHADGTDRDKDDLGTRSSRWREDNPRYLWVDGADVGTIGVSSGWPA